MRPRRQEKSEKKRLKKGVNNNKKISPFLLSVHWQGPPSSSSWSPDKDQMSPKTLVHKRLKAPNQPITCSFPFSEDTKGIPRSWLLGIVLKMVTLPLGAHAPHITATNKVSKSCKALVRNVCREIAHLLSNVATESQRRTCSLNSLQRGHRVRLAPSSPQRSGLRGR